MGCPLSPKFSPSPKYSEALALDAVEPFDLGWGKRIKDQAVSFVHVRNGFHILFIKNEIPDTAFSSMRSLWTDLGITATPLLDCSSGA